MAALLNPRPPEQPDSPEASSTIWYNYMDGSALRFYHERSLNYGPVHLDLAAFDTSAGAPVRMLQAWNLAQLVARVGDVADLTVELPARPGAGALLPPALAVRTDGACDEVIACLKVWRDAGSGSGSGSGAAAAPAPAPSPAQARRRLRM